MKRSNDPFHWRSVDIWSPIESMPTTNQRDQNVHELPCFHSFEYVDDQIRTRQAWELVHQRNWINGKSESLSNWRQRNLNSMEADDQQVKTINIKMWSTVLDVFNIPIRVDFSLFLFLFLSNGSMRNGPVQSKGSFRTEMLMTTTTTTTKWSSRAVFLVVVSRMSTTSIVKSGCLKKHSIREKISWLSLEK